MTSPPPPEPLPYAETGDARCERDAECAYRSGHAGPCLPRSYEVPYAQCLEEQCAIETDCALVLGHRGPCYLTEWMASRLVRDDLRELRARRRAP